MPRLIQSRNFNKNQPTGFSTLEMMIALAIIILTLSTVLLLVYGGQSVSADSVTNNQGIYAAQAAMEQARAKAREDFSQLAIGTTTTTAGAYTTMVTVSQGVDSSGNPDPYSKKVTVDTSWSIGSRPQHIKLSTIVANWSFALSGDTCQVPNDANWANPRVLNEGKNVNLGSGNIATALATRGSYVYVTSSGNNVFSVVNVADSKNPSATPVATLPGSQFLNNELDSVFLSGNYAYVVGYDHGGGFNDQGGTVFVRNNIAYIGTNDGKLTQFAIIDISTPTSPQVVAGSKLNLPTGYEFMVVDVSTPSGITAASVKYKFNNVSDQINLIQVYNNKAYVSTENFDNSNLLLVNGAGFTVFDVSNVPSSAPTLVGYYNSNDHGYGMVTKDPSHILLGGHGKNADPKTQLFMLNATNPASIVKYANSPLTITSTSQDGRLSGIISSGKYGFVATQTTDRTFIVVDISDPDNMSYVTSLGFASNPSRAPAGGLDCQNNVFYIATDKSADALKIIGPGPVMTAQIHDPSHNDVTNSTVSVGTAVHASVTLTAGSVAPSGTVDFKRYTTGSCNGTSTDENNVALNAGAAESSAFNPPMGNMSYKIHYDGDGVYDPMDSACLSLTVVKPTPAVVLEIHDPSEAVVTSVLPNTKVHGKATVSGTGPTPTGTVTFTFYTSNNCGGGSSNLGTITLNSGIAHPSNSSNNLGAGDYSFKARYNGDSTYLAANSACKLLLAEKLNPTVMSEIHNVGHNPVTSVNAGTVVHDKAIVSGNGPTVAGTVDFLRYDKIDCSGKSHNDGSNISLSSGAAESTNFTTGTKNMSYKVHYDGDANYNPADGPCEPLTVN